MSRSLKSLLFLGTLLQPWLVCETSLAQDLNATLLRQFCEAEDIRGDECVSARDYPAGSPCNVKLTGDRYAGRYLSSQTLLLARYESDCEARSTSNGGSIVFEQAGQDYVLKGYEPGLVFTDCVSIPRSAQQDRLVCLTGYTGQGYVESTVSEVLFGRDSSQSITTSLDALASATDSEGAYGANKVKCTDSFVLFMFTKIEPGAAAGTVLVTASYADRSVIAQACRPGARRPKDTFGKLGRGEAFLEPKAVKEARFSLDLATRELRRAP